MIETIISNDCTGGAVSHDLGMEFKSPTINLQILPEDYLKFCENLKVYINSELYECKEISKDHYLALLRMYGQVPDFPLGLVNDVLVCFQHYETFSEAKAKWDERKAKVDYEHIGFIFHGDLRYANEAIEFLKLDLPNKLALTENYKVDGSVGIYPKPGDNAFCLDGEKLFIVQAYDYDSWRRL